MSKALQSWTPRVRPLVYDSLQQDIGCQPTHGERFLSARPPIRVCIIDPHLRTNEVFAQSPLVSHATGPAALGGSLPWGTAWTAWVSSVGVRIAPVADVILPASDVGTISPVYAATKPSRLSLGFTTEGQIAIAIQKTASSVEVKWIEGGETQTASFAGSYPVLFNTGLLSFGDDYDETDLAMHYIRQETPRSLYVRFQREDFAIEHVVTSSLQARLVSLIEAGTQGLQHLIYGQDALGRDVTIYSAEYIGELDGDAMAWGVGINSGSYRLTAVVAGLPSPADKMALSLSIASGVYEDIIEEPSGILQGDQVTLSLEIAAGQYL